MILALHAAGPISEFWLYKGPALKPKAHQQWESGRRLADELLPQLQDFLIANDAEWSDLTGIIIFSGPGSFTSLRIGHTVANALADSLQIPVAGAIGDDWAKTAIAALATPAAAGPPGRPALPHYGAEANITPPAAAGPPPSKT
jgi:tRNA threonylcarbamoyladenosine biosynthesis protein TsaB